MLPFYGRRCYDAKGHPTDCNGSPPPADYAGIANHGILRQPSGTDPSYSYGPGIYWYHVDTDTWETEKAPSEPASSGYYVRGLNVVYDEFNNAFAFIGGNDTGHVPTGFWLYRYASGTR